MDILKSERGIAMKDKFNENLREARLRKKLTQQQVADRLGIAKSTYCQYETGASEPNVLRLKALRFMPNHALKRCRKSMEQSALWLIWMLLIS